MGSVAPLVSVVYRLTSITMLIAIEKHTVAMTLPRTNDQDCASHSGRKTGAVVCVAGLSLSARTAAAQNANTDRICAVVAATAGKCMVGIGKLGL